MRGKRAKQIRKLAANIRRKGDNRFLYRKMKKAYTRNPEEFREQYLKGDKT